MVVFLLRKCNAETLIYYTSVTNASLGTFPRKLSGKIFLSNLHVLRKPLSSHLRCSMKKACNFIKKETPTLVFSCEFCENFKNTFFTVYFWRNASVTANLLRKLVVHLVFFCYSNQWFAKGIGSIFIKRSSLIYL